MQEPLLATEGGPQLSQGARVANTFVAPSKTFTDILRSAACWLPLVLMVLACLGYGYSIDKKVGFTTAAEVQVTKDPKSEERMAAMPPDQRERSMKIAAAFTKGFTYGSFVIVLIVFALEALILWASFNFGLGAETTFPRVFAVVAFAALPRSVILPIITSILIWAGVGTDNFDIRNPVGTNLGYYLPDSAKWIRTAGQFFDVLSLWWLVLLIIGMAIISRKTIAQSATVILGWWALILLVSVGASAIF